MFVRVFECPFFSFSVLGVCCTFSIKFKGCLREFQEFFKKVSGKFEGCFKKVSKVFKVRLKGVSNSLRRFREYLKANYIGCQEDISVFQGGLKEVSRVFE